MSQFMYILIMANLILAQPIVGDNGQWVCYGPVEETELPKS